MCLPIVRIVILIGIKVLLSVRRVSILGILVNFIACQLTGDIDQFRMELYIRFGVGIYDRHERRITNVGG